MALLLLGHRAHHTVGGGQAEARGGRAQAQTGQARGRGHVHGRRGDECAAH